MSEIEGKADSPQTAGHFAVWPKGEVAIARTKQSQRWRSGRIFFLELRIVCWVDLFFDEATRGTEKPAYSEQNSRWSSSGR